MPDDKTTPQNNRKRTTPKKDMRDVTPDDLLYVLQNDEETKAVVNTASRRYRNRKKTEAKNAPRKGNNVYTSADELDIVSQFDREEYDDNNLMHWVEEGVKKPETYDLLSSLLEKMSHELNPELSDSVKASWSPNEGTPQEIAFYSKAKELYFGGAAGGGKLVLNNQNVLSPFGWKSAKDVKKGDTLVAVDGTATKVLAVYPHNNIESYRVTFADGASIDVGDDHLWMFWYASKRVKAERKYILYSPEKGIHFEDVRGKLGLTSELYEYHKQQEAIQARGGRPYWLIIPLCEPVRFTRPSKTLHGDVIRIDPYFLGLLLGDGTITGTNNSLQLTTTDDEILEWVKQHYGEENVRWDGIKQIRFNQSAELRQKLESYKLLGTNSFTKFIPEAYLFAGVETRIELMRGLMDTDGYVDSRGHMSYTSVSYQLAKDVQHLARSLGMKATITSDIGKYRNDEGEIVECKEAYTVYLQGDDMGRFVKLSRKKERVKAFNGGVSEAGRRITSIEPIGKHDGVCFAIDHPSGLHVVQDFIVTHNSDLLIGLATSELSPHKNSIIFRTTFQELKWIIKRTLNIFTGKGVSFVSNPQFKFKGLPRDKSLELGYASSFDAAQKYMGRPHDLKLWDELANFPESVYTFLNAWARTDDPSIPVRVVAAGNPPMTADGEWVVQRFAPWLDQNHTNPAVPGELRWFATLDGVDKEIEGNTGEPFIYRNQGGVDELITPLSRTFVRSTINDNPYYMRTNYAAQLQGLKEPFRSILLNGSFELVNKADPFQLVRRVWVNESNRKWAELYNEGKIEEVRRANKKVSYGLDVGSTSDPSCLVRMVDNVVDYVFEFSEPDLMKQVDILRQLIFPSNAAIGVDANGIGLGLAQRLTQLGFNVLYLKGSFSSKKRTKDKMSGFLNMRSEMWWRVREALNPDDYLIDELGVNRLILPENEQMLKELVAPKFERYAKGNDYVIQIEDQASITKKIGSSPNRANALMYALRAQTPPPPMRMV